MKTTFCWKTLILVSLCSLRTVTTIFRSKNSIHYILCVTFSEAPCNINETVQKFRGISPFPTPNVNLCVLFFYFVKFFRAAILLDITGRLLKIHVTSQLIFSCSKSTIEILENSLRSFWCFYC